MSISFWIISKCYGRRQPGVCALPHCVVVYSFGLQHCLALGREELPNPQLPTGQTSSPLHRPGFQLLRDNRVK